LLIVNTPCALQTHEKNHNISFPEYYKTIFVRIKPFHKPVIENLTFFMINKAFMKMQPFVILANTQPFENQIYSKWVKCFKVNN